MTRAQAKKYDDSVNLSDSFMSSGDQNSAPLKCKEKIGHSVSIELHPSDESLKMSVGKEQLMREQKSDPTSCFL